MGFGEDNASIDSALAYYFECLDRGEALDEASLLAKFPQYSGELKSYFEGQRLLNGKVQQLRSSGPTLNRLSVRCPNCRQPMEVAVDSSLTDIECPSCASRFSLVGPAAATNGSVSLMTMGRFQLLERLGVGAYGSVWKARDDALDRLVAVKLPRQSGMTPEEQEKFFREARASAQLRHPNIVRVYEVGRDGDSVYIVSDLVHGMTLGDWLEGNQLSPREAAGLGVTIADALHHAHVHGVVHRDLKPGNIIMDADGRPHVMDFGLARRDAGEVTVTMDGQVLGTPAYMSPEQAEGKAHAADRRSDVYSLGVIMYQLLTSELPFRGNARMLLHQVIHDDPPSPRKLNAHVPRDIETIVGKAMEKRPADRYASAKELADDLRRYLAGEPIKARPASTVEKIVKWSRRHRAIVSIVAGAAALLAAVVVASFLLINKERVTALAALDDTSEMLYMADMSAAYEAWDQGWSDEAQTILSRQRPKDARPDQRGFEWFLLDRLTRPPVPTALAGHEGGVNELAVFPGGRYLASVGDDGTLRIWDLDFDRTDMVRQRTETIRLGKDPLYSVAVYPNGRYVAAGSKTLYLSDAADRANPRELFRADHNFESLAFCPDGKRLVGGQRYHELILFTVDGEIVRRVPCTSRIESLEFTPESQLLVPNRRQKGSGTLSVAQIWDNDLLSLEREYERPEHPGINNLRLSPSGKFIAVRDLYGAKIYVFDRASGRVLLETLRGRASPTALSYSPDGRTVAVGYTNGTFDFVDLGGIADDELAIRRPRGAVHGHDGSVFDLKFIRDQRIATCGADGLVKIWNLKQIKRPRVVHELKKVLSMNLSPDGRLLACADESYFKLLDQNEHIKLWSKPVKGKSKRLSWSPSGNRVAVCCGDQGEVVIFDKSGELVSTIAHERPEAAAFSPDDEWLAIIGGRSLQLCRAVESGEVYRRPLASEAGCVAFSPDGRCLAYGGRSNSITLVDSTGQRVQRELPCDSATHVVAFSPDGSMLASGHADSVIRLWSMVSGKLKAKLTKHERTVESLGFSADGRTLLSAARDGTVRAWAVDHGRDYGVVFRAGEFDGDRPALPEFLCDFSLSSNDRRLAIMYTDPAYRDVVEVWDLQDSTHGVDNAMDR